MSTGAEPILIDYLRPRDWRQLARAAVLLDLSEGDYFDVHGICINLWAGPANKPAGWPPELAITAGELRYPRAYVGTIPFSWGDHAPDWASDQVYPVALQIGITEVRDWRWATATHWRPNDPEAGRVVDDEAWCRRQWQRLKQFAEVGRP